LKQGPANGRYRFNPVNPAGQRSLFQFNPNNLLGMSAAVCSCFRRPESPSRAR